MKGRIEKGRVTMFEVLMQAVISGGVAVDSGEERGEVGDEFSRKTVHLSRDVGDICSG